MYKPKLAIAGALLFCLNFTAKAQQLRADTAVKKNTVRSVFINAGLQYLSTLTYAGRRDAGSVPVLLPTLTLITRQGFFLSAIGYLDLNGNNSHAEGLSVTPGYVFSFDDKKQYGGAISVTKYFITNNSPIILSTFDATIDGQLHFNPDDIVKMTVAASYRIGKENQNDIINDVELSKEIQLTKGGTNGKDGFKINPTATLYAGTQTFTQPVDSASLVRNFLNGEPTQTSVKKYNLLAFSGSMQLTYAIKTWQISFTPYLIKPFNTGQNGWYFLFTTGVSATF